MAHNQLQGDDLFLSITIEDAPASPKSQALKAVKKDETASAMGSAWAVEGSNQEYAGLKIWVPLGRGKQARIKAHSFKEHWLAYRDSVVGLSHSLKFHAVPPPPKPRYSKGPISFEYQAGWNVFEEADRILLTNATQPPTPGALEDGISLVQIWVDEVSTPELHVYPRCVQYFQKQFPGLGIVDGGAYGSGAFVLGAYKKDMIQFFQFHPTSGKQVVVTAFKPLSAKMQALSFGGIKASLRYGDRAVFPEDE